MVQNAPTPALTQGKITDVLGYQHFSYQYLCNKEAGNIGYFLFLSP